MRTFLVGVLVALGGCYAPNPPSGAYLCGDGEVCPAGLTCECGQCVRAEGEAACRFEIVATKNEATIDVEEHEPFSLTVKAYDKADHQATSFNAEIKLSSTWGDICVGAKSCASMPNRVKLTGGTATIDVTLNRETIAPQSAILRAEFAGNVGTSGKLPIYVRSPVFARADKPVIAPLQLLPPTSFGFATAFAGAPAVAKVEGGWRMYFTGAHVVKAAGKDEVLFGLGVATSTDGITFSPVGGALLESKGDDPQNVFGVSSVIVIGEGARLFFARGQTGGGVAGALGYSTVARLRGTGTTGPFLLDGNPVITTGSTGDASCTYCTALDAPGVLPDPDPALSGGTANAEILYFSSVERRTDTGGKDSTVISIGRAASLDGETFTVDPAAVLRSNGDEIVLFSPRVILDGTVYKMFYSVVGFDGSRPLTNLVDPCDAEYHVGYATSTDGYFWVRSLRNTPPLRSQRTAAEAPVFDVDRTAGGWEGGSAAVGSSILVGSVVPTDGIDPENGIALYYSPFLHVAGACLPNGVGRAVRR